MAPELERSLPRVTVAVTGDDIVESRASSLRDIQGLDTIVWVAVAIRESRRGARRRWTMTFPWEDEHVPIRCGRGRASGFQPRARFALKHQLRSKVRSAE